MGICNFCDSGLNDFDAECINCGFNASSGCFNEKITQLYFIDSMREDWRKGIRFVYKLNEYLIQKKGSASTNPDRGGWSITKTAKLLGKCTATISQQINLAKELPNYPDLENSKTSNIAITKLKEIKSGGPTSDIQFEINLQNRIIKQWGKLFAEWELLSNESGFDTKEIGILDFFAKHISENKRYLVIELKKDQSSDKTVGQILRYMGWVKNKLAGENGRVEGIIISRSIDININYALEYTENIGIKYWIIKKDELFIIGKDEYDIEVFSAQFKTLSPEQLNKLLTLIGS